MKEKAEIRVEKQPSNEMPMNEMRSRNFCGTGSNDDQLKKRMPESKKEKISGC